MDKHYYLVAQLPYLVFGRETYLGVEAFLQEAEKWLGGREYAVLARVDSREVTPAQGDPATLRAYKGFELSLRTELAQWRGARRLGQDYRPVDFPVQLFEDGNPLEIEVRLLRLRWDYLEALEVGHHFDLDVLVIHLLKLQLLRRLAAFDRTEGQDRFRQLCEVSI